MSNILVLGAGISQRVEGAKHHDQFPFPGIDYVFNLDGAWFPGYGIVEQINRYDKIICTHVVEHVRSLVYFMNQAHTLLKNSGVLEIETPNAGVNFDLTHCDPTHVRCFRPYTFENYFTPHGIAKFGYTQRAWRIHVLDTFQLEQPNDCIRFIGSPIKAD